MRTNYVLVDFENVQPEGLAGLNQDPFKVIVFVGASQTKVSFETAAALQQMGNRAAYVKISGNGRNALDFHIAFYIGQIAVEDPNAYFHIISDDGGFDPLIAYLKSKNIFASRSHSINDIPLVKATNSKTPDNRLGIVITDLQRRKASKPRTIKTLSSTISSLFQKQLADDELEALLAELQAKKVITVSDSKVAYHLPA